MTGILIREKGWTKHVNKEAVQSALHVDADTLYKDAKLLAKSMANPDIKSDPLRPTAAAINNTYQHRETY